MLLGFMYMPVCGPVLSSYAFKNGRGIYERSFATLVFAIFVILFFNCS